MQDPVVSSANRLHLHVAPTHNINEFLDSRYISASYLAELCGIKVDRLKAIIDVQNDPMISELITVHQGINRVATCTLEELINTDTEIYPRKMQIFNLEIIKRLAGEIMIRLYPEAEKTPLHDLVERDNSASAFTRFGLQLLTHLDGMFRDFSIHEPFKNPYLDQPAGTYKLNCIRENVDIKGKKHTKILLAKYSRTEKGLISPEDMGLADYKLSRGMFNPYQNFRLSEITGIMHGYFNANCDNGALISDLIYSPVLNSGNAPESSLARFKSSFMILGQLFNAFAQSEQISSKFVSSRLKRIEDLMDQIDPGWKDHSSSNAFGKRSAHRSADEYSARVINPVKVTDLSEEYL